MLIVPLIVGGCIGGSASAAPKGPSATGSPAGASAATLDGRTFLSTSVEGHVLVPDSTVRMSFQGGQLGISAGCNHMGGAYSILEGQLKTGQMMMTEMACKEPLMAQDTWVGSFVDDAAVKLAGDTLTLSNGDVTMTLRDREVADPDRPLQGTRWVVDGIIAGDTVSSVPEGVTASVTIANDQLMVQIGCSGGVALVQVTTTAMTIGQIAPMQSGCAPDGSAFQKAVWAALSGQVDYKIEADSLTLTAGPAGLTLRAAK